MPRKRLPYKEGDWFAVPLRDGGYALGLVARMNGKGSVLGYFFGPWREQCPTKEDTQGLSSADAILVRLFGDLGLLEGKWPILGRSDLWDRADWPLPAFARIAVDKSRAWRVEYSEADINQVVREVPVNPNKVSHLPEDGLSGSGALEIRLTQLLSARLSQTKFRHRIRSNA